LSLGLSYFRQIHHPIYPIITKFILIMNTNNGISTASEDCSVLQPEPGHHDTYQPGVGNHNSKQEQSKPETQLSLERFMSAYSVGIQSDVVQSSTVNTLNWSRLRKVRQYSPRRGKGASHRSQEIVFLPIALGLSISTLGTIYKSNSGGSFSWYSLLFPTVTLIFTTTLLIYTIVLNHIEEEKSVRQPVLSPPLLGECEAQDGGAVKD